ncbi:MAG: pyruvate dehydrogenase complex dihydrolipoamide acetyltransferase, partial [Hyphomicrobiales bacterium]|nr:pyruvate dehydrogenase complex dihydrolipoamide acetyltransferase [Hyphomicrobiales bacterium]
MPTPILMPALSPTMEKGKLAKWLKAEGDDVKSGDILAEIETDKATMEVEAVDEGTMGKILVAEGTDDVPVNELIAVLLDEGEDASAADGFTAAAPPPAPPHKGEGSEAPVQQAPPVSSAPSSSSVGEVAAPAPGGVNIAPTANGTRVFASPLA